ncbi:MAG: abortive infection family protein [Candidatus Obscuribacterales bacterium]
MVSDAELIAKVERLRQLLEDGLTGKGYADDEYRELRRDLISIPKLKNRLPPFLMTLREAKHLYHQVKDSHPSYASRRQWLADEFTKALTYLENDLSLPVKEGVTQVLSKVDAQHVEDCWRKALDRLNIDPEGAITTARSLVETVCKYILESEKVSYRDDGDLLKIYGATAKHLQLSPSDESEPAFRQVLSGCVSIVNGVAALRNKHSDAHGKGLQSAPTYLRHARLAVSVAGAAASFLIETWEGRLAEQGLSLPHWTDDPENLQMALDLVAEDMYAEQQMNEMLDK